MALPTWMCLAGSAKAFHTGQAAAGPVPVRSPAQIQIGSHLRVRQDILHPTSIRPTPALSALGASSIDLTHI